MAAKEAHDAVQEALLEGRLVRPAVCERCGGGGIITSAHGDYSRPLDVWWLCQRCHMAEDLERPKGGIMRTFAVRFLPEPVRAPVVEEPVYDKRVLMQPGYPRLNLFARVLRPGDPGYPEEWL